MATHLLHRVQDLPVSRSELWDFIATPRNLDRITPPDLGFEILSEVPERMYTGLMIRYRVRLPLLGRREWLTEIKAIEDGVRFVDEQRVGPYALWHHEHELADLAAGGTRMTDRITYRLPFGPVGSIAHHLFVRRALERIFAHRRTVLDGLFQDSAIAA